MFTNISEEGLAKLLWREGCGEWRCLFDPLSLSLYQIWQVFPHPRPLGFYLAHISIPATPSSDPAKGQRTPTALSLWMACVLERWLPKLEAQVCGKKGKSLASQLIFSRFDTDFLFSLSIGRSLCCMLYYRSPGKGRDAQSHHHRSIHLTDFQDGVLCLLSLWSKFMD